MHRSSLLIGKYDPSLLRLLFHTNSFVAYNLLVVCFHSLYLICSYSIYLFSSRISVFTSDLR